MENKDNIKETESAFTGATAICLLAGIVLGMLIDDGLISEPAVWFYFPAAGYLFIRFIVWKVTRRVPTLTKAQRYAVSLLPFYGGGGVLHREFGQGRALPLRAGPLALQGLRRNETAPSLTTRPR